MMAKFKNMEASIASQAPTFASPPNHPTAASTATASSSVSASAATPIPFDPAVTGLETPISGSLLDPYDTTTTTTNTTSSNPRG
eukprot:JP446474.1.p5 GENE.JP446474.1~~JP446474.1.p5  ORF type:complete len:84 (+),score=23.31 JP446474.1:627-878(+)